MENTKKPSSKKVSKNVLIWGGIALVVLLALLLGYLVKKNNVYQEGHQKFTSTDATFSLDYPRTWDAEIGENGAIAVTFVDNSDVSLSAQEVPYIHVSKGAIGADNIDTLYAETLEKYQKTFKDMVIIKEGSAEVDGVPARRVLFNGILGGVQKAYAIVFFIKDGITYVVTGTTPIENGESLEKEVTNIISSWKFENGQPATQSTDTDKTEEQIVEEQPVEQPAVQEQPQVDQPQEQIEAQPVVETPVEQVQAPEAAAEVTQ